MNTGLEDYWLPALVPTSSRKFVLSVNAMRRKPAYAKASFAGSGLAWTCSPLCAGKEYNHDILASAFESFKASAKSCLPTPPPLQSPWRPTEEVKASPKQNLPSHDPKEPATEPEVRSSEPPPPAVPLSPGHLDEQGCDVHDCPPASKDSAADLIVSTGSSPQVESLPHFVEDLKGPVFDSDFTSSPPLSVVDLTGVAVSPGLVAAESNVSLLVSDSSSLGTYVTSPSSLSLDHSEKDSPVNLGSLSPSSPAAEVSVIPVINPPRRRFSLTTKAPTPEAPARIKLSTSVTHEDIIRSVGEALARSASQQEGIFLGSLDVFHLPSSSSSSSSCSSNSLSPSLPAFSDLKRYSVSRYYPFPLLDMTVQYEMRRCEGLVSLASECRSTISNVAQKGGVFETEFGTKNNCPQYLIPAGKSRAIPILNPLAAKFMPKQSVAKSCKAVDEGEWISAK